MKKKDIIKESIIFNDVINNGKCLKNHYYNIFYKENDLNRSLFGFAIGKKIGNAVTRNKNKRQLKNIVDYNHNLFSNCYYYIIMVKKDINSLSYQEKEKYLLELLNKENTNEK